ncbi:hypothetical protein ACOMHN_031529 [Nucella lapillus]
MQSACADQRRIDENITVLYDWCRSLQEENNQLKTEVIRLTEDNRNQPIGLGQSLGQSSTEEFSNISNWCQFIEADNKSLKQDMKYLSSLYEALESQCRNLLDWNNHFSDKSVTMDKKLEKLETDSRARNVKFFNVFKGRSTNDSDCVRQVIQLLNRFYPS